MESSSEELSQSLSGSQCDTTEETIIYFEEENDIQEMDVEEYIDQESVAENFVNVKAITLRPESVDPSQMVDETDCPVEAHTSNRKDLTDEEFIKINEENETAFKGLQSISLLSLQVYNKLLFTISDYCPNLTCLNILDTEFARISHLPIYEIAPKLTHLSANGSIRSTDWILDPNLCSCLFTVPHYPKCYQRSYPGSLHDIIKRARLTDLSLSIGAQDNFTGNEFKGLSDSLDGLILLNLSYEENSENSEAEKQIREKYLFSEQGDSDFQKFKTEPMSSLENAMMNLYLSSGNNLKYLRIHNNYDVMALYRALDYISLFENLRALNLSFRNTLTTNPENSFFTETLHKYYEKVVKKLSKLVSLTLMFEKSLRNTLITGQVLYIFTKLSKFQNSLKRLRLIDASLDSHSLLSIHKTFSNLQSVQLVDCLFNPEHIGDIIDTITKIKNLYEFIFENYSSDENSGLVGLTMDNLKTIVSRCNKLKIFELRSHLPKKQKDLFQDLCDQKGIKFVFKNMCN